MAIETNFGDDPLKPWFIGEDKILEFEVFSDDGKPVTDPTKGMEDVSTWNLVWSMKKTDVAGEPALVEKRTSGNGITVVGAYAPLRPANLQRVQVRVLDTDTDSLKPDKGKTVVKNRQSLKRILVDGDAILAFGNATLRKATAPPE